MIKVRFQTQSFRRGLEAARRNQIPFATSMALSNVAYGARNLLRFNLSRHFTLRRAQHIKGGIRAERATKLDLKSSVGSIDQYMALQAESGTKRGQAPGLAAIVPTKKLRKTLQSVIPKRLYPEKLVGRAAAQRRSLQADEKRSRLKSRKPFVTQLDTGDSKRSFIVRRATKKRYPLQILWILPRKVKIPERWDFDEQVGEYVRANWGREMTRALDRALRTAK